MNVSKEKKSGPNSLQDRFDHGLFSRPSIQPEWRVVGARLALMRVSSADRGWIRIHESGSGITTTSQLGTSHGVHLSSISG